MNSISQRILTNWSPRRWIVLAIGLFFAIQALIFSDGLIAVLGAFFLFQAATNTGCMLSGACGIPAADQVRQEPADISSVEFTEIKED